MDMLVATISLAGLFLVGLKFLEHSIYRVIERRNPAAHILFAVVFALSAFMLELLVFEVVGILDLE